ncbi:Bug family tripartite tricarboxylate transporter substrate binding protein [Siccirubricoccus phaeus]|uniref:Bug family tripartite tricarboxylate transporter substrate binding protein n=1 Tax=Siccirubricoccus phaeus TaxID=2595053 RepID=UPI0011F1BC82|nr:tripartite tricarboxylate transporter substrate binding protein [Siccirubricoccus phaeus]
MTTTRRALLATLPLLATPALAQSGPWPNRPVRMVIPFPPGASTDAVGRTTAAVIGARIGQPVVAENRGGAGGNIGAEAVAKSAPDGYTLLITTISAAVMGPHLYTGLGYDPVKDLAPVARTCHTPNCIAVRADLPVNTLQEAFDLIRSRPGALTMGSPGNGTSGHLIGESINRAAGLSLQHIPYRGTAPMMTDLLAGRLDVVHDNLPAYLPQAREGKLKVLAVTSAERWYSAPEIPTVAEAANMPGFAAMIWWGVQAPAGTPAPILQRVAEAILEGFGTPEVKERLQSFSIQPAPLGAAEFADFMATEYRRWGEVVREAKITLG